MGFVAFNWLLGHVPATMVGTYAYVNPLVAILVGWLLGGEEMTVGIVVGFVVILSGVALVRGGGVKVKELRSSKTQSVPCDRLDKGKIISERIAARPEPAYGDNVGRLCK